MVNVGQAVGYLDLDTSGFKRGFSSAGNDLAAFNDKSKSTESRVAALGSTFTSAGGSLTAGLTLPLLGVGVAALKVGNEFESQMSRVKAISGATEAEFAALEKQAIELGASTAFSALEAAEGMENLASAGFTVTEIMAAMGGMMDLAASDGLDLATAAEIASSILRGFALDAADAGHVADVLAESAARTNAGVTDMGEAMKYIAPVANAMGISLEDTAAAIGIMSDAGIKGSQAGTTLRGALTRLVKPTDKMLGVMDDLGLSFFDLEGNMKPLPDMISMLQEKTQGLTQEQRNQALAILFGQEALSGMLVLTEKGGDSLAELSEGLQNSDGAAASMAATMRDNASASIEEMMGSFESAGIAIQKVLAPAIRDLTDWVSDLIGKFLDLDEGSQKTIVMILAIVAAIGPLMLIIGKVIGLVAVILPLITKLKVAFAALNLIMALNPAVAIAAGIALLIAGVIALVAWINRDTAEQKKLADQTERTVKANDKLIDSLNASTEAHDERISSIESETGATQGLADKVFALSAVENKSAQDKEKLRIMVDMLNQSMGENILKYDAEHDALSKTQEQINSVIEARKEEIKTQANQERAIEIAKEMAAAEEQLNAITRQRIELELAKAEGVYDGYYAIRDYQKQQDELSLATEDLNTVIGDLTESFDYQTDKIVESAEVQAQARNDLADEWVAANGEMMASEDDMISKNKELQESAGEYTNSVTSMFDTINEKAKGTTTEYLKTLDENYLASQTYVTNLATLLDRGLDEAIVQTWRDQGLASAGEVALWSQATDEEILALNEKMTRNMDQGMKDAASVFKLGGNDIVAGLVTGITDEIGAVEKAGTDIANAVVDTTKDALGIHSPSTVYIGIGQNLGTSLGTGLAATMPALGSTVGKLINDMTLQFSKLPGEVKKHLDTTLKNAMTWSTEMYTKTPPNIKKMVEDIIVSANRLPPEFKRVYDTVQLYTATWYTQMIQKAIEFDLNFGRAIVLNIGKLPPEFKIVYDSIQQHTNSWYTLMIVKAKELSTDFNKSLLDELKKLPDEYKRVFDEILKNLNNLKPDFAKTGNTVMTGMFDEMKKVGAEITKWINSWASDIKNTIRQMLSDFEAAESATRGSNSHAAGLDWVPYDGYQATLHKGERVLTAQENREGVGSDGGVKNYNFFSPVPITPVEARKQMVQAELEISLGFN